MDDQHTAHTQTLLQTGENDAAFWGRHRLALLLVGTVITAILLTVVSMIIYNSSGAAQLDLSRPGYRSVSSQIDSNDEIDGFSASGSIDKGTIQDFMSLYDKQAAKAKAVDAFNGDPLNPDVLEFGSPSNQ